MTGILDANRRLVLSAGAGLILAGGAGRVALAEEKNVGATEDLMREHGVLRRALPDV